MDTLTAPARVRRPVVTLWALRVAVTAHLVVVLTQPVLAGQFLTGDVDAVEVHGLLGSLIAPLALVVIALAAAYVLAGRGSPGALPPAVGLFLLDGVQIGAGYARQLQLHVPIGVLIALGSVAFTAWVWSRAAARPRGAR